MYHKQCNRNNYTIANRPRSAVCYIVYHFTANNGDTARNNVDYFARVNTGTSAHWFADDVEVASSVPWWEVAHHCGGKKYPNTKPLFFGKCTNYNSLGVEMCSRIVGGKYTITEATQKNAAKHIAQLMHDFRIPLERVIRHYDVTGKQCPAPMVDEAVNKAFKDLILFYYEGGEDVKYYETLEEIPAGDMRSAVAELMELGVIKGNGTGLHLSYDMLRIITFMYRRFKVVS